MESTNIVVLGGGFAGATLAHALERTLPAQAQVTLLSSENYITYNPLLAEVVGASILPGHVVAPLRLIAPRARFHMVTVTDVDLAERKINYLGEGSGVLSYDQLVLACGMRANLDLVPGMARYALPLKTVGDALCLRNRVIVRLEQAEMQADPEQRRWLTTFVIIGAGFSGVELAGEVSDFLRASRRYYTCLRELPARIIVLQSGERIMPELSPSLSAFALRKMRRRDIEIRLNTRVTRVDDQGVYLDSDEKLNSGTVVCTIGTAPNTLVESLPVPKERGRIKVAPDMSVPECPGVWALGDCALILNAADGKPCPPTAQFAVRQAAQLARNLARQLRGQATRPFRYTAQGQMSSIGHNKAVAEIFGVRLTGFIAWLLWRGVYLLKIPTFARKVRVFFEWNWGMLFPPDIVHMRYTQTKRDERPKVVVAKPVLPAEKVSALKVVSPSGMETSL